MPALLAIKLLRNACTAWSALCTVRGALSSLLCNPCGRAASRAWLPRTIIFVRNVPYIRWRRDVHSKRRRRVSVFVRNVHSHWMLE
jgi:hypothetical protein